MVLLRLKKKPLLFVCSTTLYIPVKVWNKKRQRIKATSTYPTFVEKNELLDKLATLVEKKYYECVAKGEVCTKEILRETVDHFFNRSKVDELSYFDAYFKKHIDESRQKKRTLKNKRRLLNTFIEHQEYRKKRYTFDMINNNWLKSFVNWSYDVKKAQSAYVAENVKRIKGIVKQAHADGIHSNKAYMNFKVTDRLSGRKRKTDFALKESEIELLRNATLEGEEDMVRDVFMVLYYTGFRYIDYRNLSQEDFKERTLDGQTMKVVLSMNRKNEKIVENPLPKKLIPFLEKYAYDIPKFTDQYLNRTIKKILQKIGITEEVSYLTDYGDVIRMVTRPKNEVITCHSFRRSLVTILDEYGLKLRDVGGYVGHANTKTTLLYIKEQATEKAFRLSQNPFFAQE